MKQKVEGHQNLYKDTTTGVIVNRETTDRSRYQIAKHNANLSMDTQTELSSLRGEIDEIKSLLHQLLQK